jgi:hypothetical protein
MNSRDKICRATDNHPSAKPAKGHGQRETWPRTAWFVPFTHQTAIPHSSACAEATRLPVSLRWPHRRLSCPAVAVRDPIRSIDPKPVNHGLTLPHWRKGGDPNHPDHNRRNAKATDGSQ